MRGAIHGRGRRRFIFRRHSRPLAGGMCLGPLSRRIGGLSRCNRGWGRGWGGWGGGGATLQGYAAVFMCDVPRVSPGLADALVGYARGGGSSPAGRIVWVLGPGVNQAAYNEVLLGNKRDLLPAPLGSPMVTT